MRNTFIDTLIEKFASHDNFFMLSGDAGLGVFDDFQKNYPDKFKNMGIAEQNMIGFGAGLALSGYKVYFYNIIPFVLYRCYEQVRNDICYQNIPAVLIGIGSGVTYAPGGMTHYSVEDLALAQTLPNLHVLSPIDPIEATLAAEYSFTCNHPTYIRLAKRGEPNIHKSTNFDITKPQVLEDGEDIAIVFHGSIANEAISAAEMLKKEGISIKLISIPFLQPLNFEALLKLTSKMKYVISLEEHYENCGLGSILSQHSIKSRAPWKLHVMGIPYQFIHSVNKTAKLREKFGISANDILNKVKTLMDSK